MFIALTSACLSHALKLSDMAVAIRRRDRLNFLRRLKNLAGWSFKLTANVQCKQLGKLEVSELSLFNNVRFMNICILYYASGKQYLDERK